MTTTTQPRIRIGTNPETHRPVNWNPRKGLGHLAVSNNSELIDQINEQPLFEQPAERTRRTLNQELDNINTICDARWDATGTDTEETPVDDTYHALHINPGWLHGKTMRRLHRAILKAPILNMHLIITGTTLDTLPVSIRITRVDGDRIILPGEQS